MPLSVVNQRSIDVSGFTVCINSIKSGNLEGKFYNTTQKDGIAFFELGSMILKMDKIMDMYKYPIQSNKSRCFVNEAKKSLPFDSTKQYSHKNVQGKIATFYITVESRKSSQWQCKLELDRGNTQRISTVYSLINAIEEYCIGQ